MKTENTIIILLIAFYIASCAPSANIFPTEVVNQTSTATPVPLTSTNTPIPPTSTNMPVPSATPIPFDISGNIAILDQDSIHIYSVDGEKIRSIQTEGWVRNFKFSRQGRVVAYSAYNKIGNDLIWFPYGLKIIDLAKNTKKTIVNSNTRVLGFFWIQADEGLIYLTLDGVYKFSTNGDMKKETLVKFPFGTFENPNESSINVYPSTNHQGFVAIQTLLKQVGEGRFQENGHNVYHISVGQNFIKKLNDERYGRSPRFGEWSPDNNYFYYTAITSESDQSPKNLVFNASSSLLVDGYLEDDYADHYHLFWSPDSRFVSQSNWTYQGKVLISSGDLSMDWNEIYPYSERSYLTNLAWSPDSNLLAMNDGSWLKVYNIQKTEVEPLTNLLRVKPRRIIWSPNGEYLVITDSEEATLSLTECNFQIYSFSKNELINVPAIACRGVESFHWLSDGKSLAFTSYSKYSSQEIKTSTIYILDAESATISDINVESIEFELIP